MFTTEAVADCMTETVGVSYAIHQTRRSPMTAGACHSRSAMALCNAASVSASGGLAFPRPIRTRPSMAASAGSRVATTLVRRSPRMARRT